MEQPPRTIKSTGNLSTFKNPGTVSLANEIYVKPLRSEVLLAVSLLCKKYYRI